MKPSMTMDQITAAYPNVAKLESQAGRELLAAVMEKLQTVVAENVRLKQAESNLVRNIINDLGDTEFQYARVQTPATDRFVAEMKAQGVEEFAASLSVVGPNEHPYASIAKAFAKQLREVGQ